MKPRKKIRKKEASNPASFLFYFLATFTILFLPVFHIRYALDAALMPRTMIMSVFILAMGFLLLGRKYASSFDFSILKQKIFPLLLGYLVVVIVSLAFSVNYKEGFFDVVRTFIFVSMVGITAIIFFHSEGWQEKLPKLVMLAALIALLLGTEQYFRHVVNATSPVLDDGRSVLYMVSGLMFHKNEYSTALMLMLPFTGYGIYSYKGLWRIASIVTAALILFMIVLVQTRAVWVGLAVSFFAVAVIYIFFARKLNLPVLYRNFLIAATIAGLALITVIFTIEPPKDPNSLISRIQSITDPQSQHNIHRISIWNSTLTLIKEHPLTGVGAGNWKLNAAYYFDGRFDQVPQLNWARPHNDYLWVFAEKGIIGFLLFMAIFGFAIYYMLAIIQGSPEDKDKILALLFFAGVIAYMVVAFFSFPYERINHQVYMGLIFGGTLAMYHKLNPTNSEGFRWRKTVLATLVVFSIFGALFGYQTTRQEMHLNKALGAYNNSNWHALLNHSRNATNPFKSLDPLSNPPEYYEGMALANLNRHHEAIVAYELAKKQFPNNMWIINWLGLSYFHVGRYQEAIDCIEQVIKIIPKHKEAYINLSATYYRLGEYQKSYDALKLIDNWESDPEIVRNMRVLENRIQNNAGN